MIKDLTIACQDLSCLKNYDFNCEIFRAKHFYYSSVFSLVRGDLSEPVTRVGMADLLVISRMNALLLLQIKQ